MPYTDEDITKAVNEAGIQAADANLSAAQGVQPAVAATAIQQQPVTGVPANTGMTDPAVGNDMADRSRRQAILSTAPTLSSYSAQSPAHAAAISDDLSPLAHVVNRVNDYMYPTGTSGITDFAGPAIQAYKEMEAARLRVEEAKARGDLPEVAAGLYQMTEGRVAGVLSPVSGAFNYFTAPLARSATKGFGPPPQVAGSILTGIQNPVTGPLQQAIDALKHGAPKPLEAMTPEESTNFYNQALGLATMFLGGKGTPKPGVSLALRGAGEAEAAGASVAPELRPGGGFHLTPEGNVGNAAGETTTFSSPRQAADWISQTGYGHEHGQLFEIANGAEQGTWVVKATRDDPLAGTTPPPGADPVADQARADVAQASADANKEIMAAAQETETHGRAPSILADIINREAPSADVELPARTAAEVENLPDYGLSPGEIAAAAQAGTPLSVPYGDFVTATAGHPNADAIVDSARLPGNDVSVNEGKDLADVHKANEDLLAPADNAAELQATPVYQKTFQSYVESGITKEDVLFDIKMLTADIADGMHQGGENEGLAQIEDIHEKLQAIKDYYGHLEANGAHLDQGTNEPFTWTGGEVDEDFNHVVASDPELNQAPGWIELQRVLKTQAVKLKAAARRAVTQSYLRPLFSSPSAAGMSQKEFGLYSKQIEASHKEVYRKMLERMVARVKRNRTRVWKEAYHRNYTQVVAETMATPGIRAYHILKYTAKDGLTVGNAFVKNGKLIDFYHGTSHTSIEKWEARGQPVISFSTDPEFASRWAGEAHGSMVYIVHLKAKNPADFRKPEDVDKAAGWIAEQGGSVRGTAEWENRKASIAPYLRAGSWSQWELPEMWKDLGWDAAYMKESAESPSVNACVADGNQVFFKYRLSEQLGEVKLSNEVKKSLPEELLASLPSGIFAKDGVSLDALGDVVGSNGHDLLLVLRKIERDRKAQGLTFKQWLKKGFEDEATQRTADETGLNLDPADIEAEARASIIAPVAEDVLTTELSSLAQRPIDKAMVQLKAHELFQDLPVSRAVKIRSFENALRNLGRDAEVALLQKDPAKAFTAKLHQLQNYYMLQEAHTLVKVLGKLDKKLVRLAKRKVVKGMPQAFLNHLHELLPQLGYPTRRNPMELKDALQGTTMKDFVEALQNARPGFPDLPSIPKGPIQNLTVDQFWDLRNFMQAYEKVARSEHLITTAQGTEDYEDLVNRAIEEAPPPGKPPKYRAGGRKNFLERMASKGKGFDAAHRKMSDIAEKMGQGKDFSVFEQMLDHVPESAADVEGFWHRTISKRLSESFNNIPKEVRNQYHMKIPDHSLLGPDDQPIELLRADLVGMAQHVGTASNLEKLAEGYKTIAPEIMELLDKYLVKEEWDFIQDYWDGFAELKGPLNKVLREQTGIGLEEIPARKVETRHGTYRGGYSPVDYDKDLSPTVAQLQLERDAKYSGNPMNKLFYSIVPSKSFSVKRTGFAEPMLFRLSDLITNYNSHIKYIAWGKTAADIRKFVTDPRIRTLVQERMGKEYYSQINPWLDDLVLDWTVPPPALRDIEGWARQLIANNALATLGFSYSVGLGQIAGGFSSAALLSDGKVPGEGATRFAGGLWKFYKAAFPTASSWVQGDLASSALEREMFSKSEFMRQKFGQIENNLVQYFNSIQGELGHLNPTKEFYHKAQKGALHYIGFMEFITVSGPAWFAAKDLAEGRGLAEKQAILFANKHVRDSQGSGRTASSAAVQRGGPFMRFWYQFQSWGNASYNLMTRMFRQAGRGNFGKFMALMIGVFVLSPLVSALFSRDGPEDYEPKTLLKWALQKQFFNYFRPIMGAGSVSQGLDRAITTAHGRTKVKRYSDIDFSNDPLTSQAEANARFAAMAMGLNRHERRPVQTTATAIGKDFGVPGAVQAGRSAEYLYEFMKHQQHPKNPLDFISGLANGPPPKRSS